MVKKIHKSLDEWQQALPRDVFEITRGKGTEPAFNNSYWDNKKEGIYKCSNCDLTLFSSKNKYDAGTGWPSFWKPMRKDYVTFHIDRSAGMVRKEALCARCGSHLGHVFDDGPRPTGLRFCMNSASLIFKAKQPQI